MKVLYVLLLILLVKVKSRYSTWAKSKFETNFNNVCMKYDWVQRYIQSQSDNSVNRYAVFIFDDHHTRARKGGLGDRFGGLITTFAYAMRSKRTFLIEANKDGLGKLFKPYQQFTNKGKDRSWSDLGWSKFNDRIPNHNKTYLWCVNPKPSQTFCALDSHHAYEQYSIVRLRINRSYLCRWASNKHLLAHEEVKSLLNITDTSNLFEIGGCMLRLALWPTQHLWNQLDEVFKQYPTLSYQVGFHYRCGDHNYKGAHLHPEMENHYQCIVKPGTPWNGTHAVDELSMASPVDSGKCGQSVLSGHKNAIAYIASDSIESAKQISDTLSYPNTVIAPPGCHIDFDPSAECSHTTLLYWFILTLSDESVYQSYVDNEINAELFASSFSRYAMMYSLNSGNKLLYASTCQSTQNPSTSDSVIWNSTLSRIPQGNWVCTGGKIY